MPWTRTASFSVSSTVRGSTPSWRPARLDWALTWRISGAQESGRAGRDGQASQAIMILQRLQGRDYRNSAPQPEWLKLYCNRFCKRVVLDQYLDGRVNRVRCEFHEESCEACQASNSGPKATAGTTEYMLVHSSEPLVPMHATPFVSSATNASEQVFSPVNTSTDVAQRPRGIRQPSLGIRPTKEDLGASRHPFDVAKNPSSASGSVSIASKNSLEVFKHSPASSRDPTSNSSPIPFRTSSNASNLCPGTLPMYSTVPPLHPRPRSVYLHAFSMDPETLSAHSRRYPEPRQPPRRPPIRLRRRRVRISLHPSVPRFSRDDSSTSKTHRHTSSNFGTCVTAFEIGARTVT